MIATDVFNAVASLFVSASSSRLSEHQDFLQFYKTIVETTPTEAVSAFGLMPVNVKVGSEEKIFQIQLSVTDYIWWKQQIEILGIRFVSKPIAIQAAMLCRLTKLAESQKLTPDERKQLLALLT